jgi:GT2 family glycosyltransferase
VHCWGMFGSCSLLMRTDHFRQVGNFDRRFRRAAELDFAVRAALGGAHFISVDAALLTQHLTTTVDKAEADLRFRLLLIDKHRPYLKTRRGYRGAWINARAQAYCSEGSRWWRLWYIAALVCFPWGVSWARLRRSSLLARLGLAPATATRS